MLVPTTPTPGNPWVSINQRPGYDSLFDWLRGTPYDQRMAYYWNANYANQGGPFDVTGLNQYGRNPTGSSSAKVSTKKSNPMLADLLNRILDQYQQAYNEYRQAVEERYAQAKTLAEGVYKRNIGDYGTQQQPSGGGMVWHPYGGQGGQQGQEGRFLALERQIVPQWYQRSQTAIDMLQGLGEQQLKDIERQYKEREGRLRQELTSRGLAGTTIPASVSMITEREKQDALGRAKESLRQHFLNVYLDTTKDAITAAESLGLKGIEIDRTLTKDIIDILANRDDIPPNLSQLIELARLASTGLVQEESNIEAGTGAGGGGGIGGGIGGGMGGGAFPIIGALPPTYMFPYPIRYKPPYKPRPKKGKKEEEETEEPMEPIEPIEPIIHIPPGAELALAPSPVVSPVVGPGVGPSQNVGPYWGPYPYAPGMYPYPYPMPSGPAGPGNILGPPVAVV